MGPLPVAERRDTCVSYGPERVEDGLEESRLGCVASAYPSRSCLDLLLPWLASLVAQTVQCLPTMRETRV